MNDEQIDKKIMEKLQNMWLSKDSGLDNALKRYGYDAILLGIVITENVEKKIIPPYFCKRVPILKDAKMIHYSPTKEEADRVMGRVNHER